MKQLIITIITVALITIPISLILALSPKDENTATADVAIITSDDDTTNNGNDRRFKRIDYDWETGSDIMYDKYTKVMYVQARRSGALTVIVDENGKPVLYKGE